MFEWLLLGGLDVGGDLFKYNRTNFMFDGKMQLKREYQGQSMRIMRFNLYREDIRDLVNLTISKMDNYLIVNTIQLSTAVVLFTEGKPHTDAWFRAKDPWPHRIVWLYSLCNAGAVLYFLLSVWLAMHASIAAHSFGVRLLTQFVRLPVPTRQQLDAARAQAQDYEGKGRSELLRVPVWREQMERAGLADAAEAPENSAVSPDEDSLTPSEQLSHIGTYRKIQANWIAYDAYSRVCMCMGANQFVHAVAYFCLGVFIVENRAPVVGLTSALVCCVATWLVVKLDIYAASKKLFFTGVLFLIAPTCGALSLTIDVLYGPGVSTFASWLMPLVFALHLSWIIYMMWLCKATECNGVLLPTALRSVLYLDVFGWMSPPAPTGEAHAEAPEADAEAPEVAMVEEEERLPVASERRTGSDGSTTTNRVRESLLGECQRSVTALLCDIERWHDDRVRECLSEDIGRKVANYRERLREIESELSTEAGRIGRIEESPDSPRSTQDQRVWLRLEYYSDQTGEALAYYYCLDPEETVWTRPQDPDRVSDLESLIDQIHILFRKVYAYRGSPGSSPVSRSASASAASATPLTGRPRRHRPAQTGQNGGSFSPSSTATSSADLDDNVTQGNQVGCPDAVELTGPDLYRGTFLTTGAQVGSTFFPQQETAAAAAADADALARQRRDPGEIPARTFWQASLVLICIWACGLVWNTLDAAHIVVPLFDPSEPLNSTDDAHGPDLIFEGGWPHPLFSPTGLACHPAAGPVLLVASRYAVHALDPGASARGPRESNQQSALPAGALQPALVQCLAAEPEFHAAGIEDISIECAPPERGAECAAVLLGAGGDRALRCGLAGGRAAGAPVPLPGGQRWRSLAAGPDAGALWALGPGELAELGRRRGRGSGGEELVPQSKIFDEAVANSTKLHVLAGGEANAGAVVALEAEGVLRVWPRNGGGPLSRLLPDNDGGRWAGLCSAGGALYLARGARGRRPAGVWRLPGLRL